MSPGLRSRARYRALGQVRRFYKFGMSIAGKPFWLIKNKEDAGERGEGEGDFDENTAEANLKNQVRKKGGVTNCWKYHLPMAYCKRASIPSVRQRSVRNRNL